MNSYSSFSKNIFEKKFEAIKCDGSGEQNSKNFNIFYKNNDLIKEITTPCAI